MRNLLSVIIALFALALIISPFVLRAQVPNLAQSLEISPPTQDIDADPGKTIFVKAKVRNRSNSTIPITVRIEDFTAEGEAGQVAIVKNSPWSVVNWTKLSPTDFSLKPNDEQTVTAEISIPPNGEAGGRYGAFVFSVTGPSQKGTAGLAQEIASLFLVRISGPVDEKLALETFSAPSFSEFGPINFSLKFNNGGNVFVKTYGLINVTDMLGHRVDDVVVTGTNVFPGSKRAVLATLNKTFLLGNYTATALLNYGSNNQPLTSVTTFFVFPVRIVAGLVILLVLIFLMRKRLIKAFKALVK